MYKYFPVCFHVFYWIRDLYNIIFKIYLVSELPRFNGITQTVTLSAEDMRSLMQLPPHEIDNWSPVKVTILPDWEAVMQTLARTLVDTIKANNDQGKRTTLILPVGPVAQYPIAAQISNEEKVSWKQVWTFNMDEYLDWEGRPIPPSHPWSFHRSMEENLFTLLDPALRIPEQQRWFPDPMNPDAIDDQIDALGGIDVAYGGIGLHGHIAFNEPVDTFYLRLTPQEFKQSRTRVVSLNSDTMTRTLRAGHNMPPLAVTLGMRVILEARKIILAGNGSVFRIAAMHPPSMNYPVTYIQEHPNPKETVTLYADTQGVTIPYI